MLLDKASAKPLYVQMEELFWGKLDSGEWSPGALIPSENELSHMYGISRTTVRNVITKLVQEEVLFRIPGKGTYVAEPKIVAQSLSYAGIREQLEKMGYEVSTRVLSITKETLDKKTFSKFSGIKSPVFFVVRRLRYLKKTPLSVHTSYIPAELCPDLGRHDIATEQMCTILSQDYGLHRAKTIETRESVPATAHEADLLNIAPGQPLLLLQDVIQNEDGLTFEYSKVAFRGEKIKITLEF